MRVLLSSKSANNLVLLADATPSARHFSPAETKHSFGGDFHYRLNPVTFVCISHKRRWFPLKDGSTTAWAVLFTDETLKRRGSYKFSSITLVGALTLVMHLFSFTDCHKWKHICILHFASSPTVQKVVLSHYAIQSAVCAGSQSNNPRFVTALLSALFYSHRLCEGLCISRLFLLSFFRPLRESGFRFFAETIKPSNVIGHLHSVMPI